ncbi:hypothetical protein F5146DRAFT_1004101 [Armillaria mellea]|nr:hypothetical protein F5146DRAFT_1004101 [Armillaria mellea]
MSASASEDHLPNSPNNPPTHNPSNGSFTFADMLVPLVSPIQPEDAENDESKDVERAWPTSVLLHTFTQHSNLKEQKDHALQILKLGTKIGKGLCTTEFLSFNQYSKTFIEETKLCTRVILHEELLAAQHNADKAHVKKEDDMSISPAPAPSSKPSPKLKTPHSATTDVASDWNLGGGGKTCNYWRRRTETE